MTVESTANDVGNFGSFAGRHAFQKDASLLPETGFGLGRVASMLESGGLDSAFPTFGEGLVMDSRDCSSIAWRKPGATTRRPPGLWGSDVNQCSEISEARLGGRLATPAASHHLEVSPNAPTRCSRRNLSHETLECERHPLR